MSEPDPGDGLEPRPPADSVSTVSELMMPGDVNNLGHVFGGVVLSMVDRVAAVAAMRHSGRPSVTVSIDRVDFREPIFAGELVTCRARVNYVGTTSMEVGVEVVAEDLLSGEKRHTNTCFLTFVAIDEDDRPVPVPGLALETDEDRRRFRDGQRRREARQDLERELEEDEARGPDGSGSDAGAGDPTLRRGPKSEPAICETAMPLTEGETAPDFVLPLEPGEAPLRLDDYRGEKPVVILFFPLAFSSDCTREMRLVAEEYDRWKRLNAEVIGISVDSPFVNRKFAEETGVSFPIVSDFNRTATDAFGVRDDDFYGLEGVSKRAAFVVDRDGRIAYAWCSDDASVLPPLDEIREAVAEAD